MLLGDLTLVPEIPEVLGIPAAQREAWRPNRRYWPTTEAGYTSPACALAVASPEQVDRFLAGPGPIVYVALCSTSADMVRRVIRPLDARRADSRHRDRPRPHRPGQPADPGNPHAPEPPDHAARGPRRDHRRAGQRANGAGSRNTFVGVPLQLEQDLNVALIERLGAARLLSRRDAQTPLVAAAARQILLTPSYRREARVQPALQHRGRPSERR